ncbi:hypothetical protein PA598K_05953, partial [Paenibacillus sp. 598K]|uniref:SMI1/KNR4 family protein n=1 Tax=Paenibacillus sp. 598K TaxID=1117987 RepID=UPI000FFA16F8
GMGIIMYERLLEKLNQTKAIRWFPNKGAEEAAIVEVEQELGYALPPSYRWWARHVNSGYMNGGNILCIGPSEYRDLNDSDLLYIHRLNVEDADWRAQFPHRLDLFVPDADELFFFDTSKADTEGEFPVMCYDLMNADIYEYAPTFAAFLGQLIDERS